MCGGVRSVCVWERQCVRSLCVGGDGGSGELEMLVVGVGLSLCEWVRRCTCVRGVGAELGLLRTPYYDGGSGTPWSC